MKYNKKYNLQFLILLGLVFIYSCTSKNLSKKDYYASGNVKLIQYYNTSKKLDSSLLYYDSIKPILKRRIIRKTTYDSVIFYYKNGVVFKTGKQNFNSLKFGSWIRSTKEGYKSDIREYFIIKDENIINRRFYLNQKGDTVWYGRKFNTYDQAEFKGDTTSSRNSIMIPFDIYHSDTIRLNEPFAAAVRCNSPLMREHNSQIIMLLAKEDANFDKFFSNEDKVKLDTFYNLNRDKTNAINFSPNANKNYIAVFGRWFKTPGKKTLRGYMLEYATFLDKETKDTLKGERKVYFEKEIYVKDSIGGNATE